MEMSNNACHNILQIGDLNFNFTFAEIRCIEVGNFILNPFYLEMLENDFSLHTSPFTVCKILLGSWELLFC